MVGDCVTLLRQDWEARAPSRTQGILEGDRGLGQGLGRGHGREHGREHGVEHSMRGIWPLIRAISMIDRENQDMHC